MLCANIVCMWELLVVSGAFIQYVCLYLVSMHRTGYAPFYLCSYTGVDTLSQACYQLRTERWMVLADIVCMTSSGAQKLCRATHLWIYDIIWKYTQTSRRHLISGRTNSKGKKPLLSEFGLSLPIYTFLKRSTCRLYISTHEYNIRLIYRLNLQMDPLYN